MVAFWKQRSPYVYAWTQSNPKRRSLKMPKPLLPKILRVTKYLCWPHMSSAKTRRGAKQALLSAGRIWRSSPAKHLDSHKSCNWLTLHQIWIAMRKRTWHSPEQHFQKLEIQVARRETLFRRKKVKCQQSDDAWLTFSIFHFSVQYEETLFRSHWIQKRAHFIACYDGIEMATRLTKHWVQVPRNWITTLSILLSKPAHKCTPKFPLGWS